MQTAATPVASPVASSPHVLGTRLRVLEAITSPDVNLSLWRRPAQADIAREVSTLSASRLPKLRHRTSADSFPADLSALLQRQGLEAAAFEHLVSDLCLLAEQFFKLSGNRDVKFQLVTTDSDNCGRFHVDTRYLRMICTYQGPGTEWLRDDQVDRFLLARGAPNDAVIRFGEPSHFQAFWVGIMKGEPGGSGNGLVHRSPSVAGSGQTRVLFCLDAEP